MKPRLRGSQLGRQYYAAGHKLSWCFLDTETRRFYTSPSLPARRADLREVRVIKPESREIEVASGEMRRVAGVSLGLVGAQGIHLALAEIPPGKSSTPHRHTNCESAIYVLRGKGRFMVGEDLKKAIEFGPGDFIYVPQNSLHQPVNDGNEEIELIVARNSPVEEVEEYEGD